MASSYTGDIGATLGVGTRLPGSWGSSAEAGVLGGVTLALGMAELAPLPPTLIHTPGLGNIGTSAINPDDRARGQFEAFPTAMPQGALPGLAPDSPSAVPLPGYGSTTPVESGSVLEAVSPVNGRKPINSKYAGKVHPSGINYNDNGFPIFKDYVEAEVELPNLTGVYSKDEKMANKAVGLEKTPTGYAWHHVEDAKTLQLIPKEIHEAARHTGGSAVLRGN